MMTNGERNTALYQKMFAEQEVFRDWLKGQSPEEILNHAYEYTVREDILLSLEYHHLSDAQADALMKSPSPLADVFRDFEKWETDHTQISPIRFQTTQQTHIRPHKKAKHYSRNADPACNTNPSPRQTFQPCVP